MHFLTYCMNKNTDLSNVEEETPTESIVNNNVPTNNQVILNILTNAAKYTENGSVTFTAHTEELSQKEEILLKVSVQDTGIGIRKEDLDHIYHPFLASYNPLR